jgi:hypothetical protein
VRLSRTIAVALLAAVALTACGSDDDTTVRSGDDVPIDPATAEGTCAAMFAEGRPTNDVVTDYDNAPCTVDGEVFVSLVATQECADGTTLSFNDLGYGYSDGAWHSRDPKSTDANPPAGEFLSCTG